MKPGRLICIFFFLIVFAVVALANDRPKRTSVAVPQNIHARIIQLEDERNLNGDELTGLLKHRSAVVRERAALAIGRIGDKLGADALIAMVEHEGSEPARAMAAFALGELEDSRGVSALMAIVEREKELLSVRARAVEALGKIVGVQANADELGKTAVERINQLLIAQPPDSKTSLEQKPLTSLTIAALMRIRSPGSVEPLARELKSNDAEIRAQAANALARLRLPIDSAVPALIEALNDGDANVRANAARALGVSKDARAVEPLIKLLNDKSEQALANTIRALAAINDNRAVEPLLALGKSLLGQSPETQPARAPQINLLLEMATALGALKDERALSFLRQLRTVGGVGANPEVENAIARFGEKEFFSSFDEGSAPLGNWRRVANLASTLGELGTERARDLLFLFLAESDHGKLNIRALPATLRAIAKFKPATMPNILRQHATLRDVGVRATVARLLGDTQSDENFDALINVFAQSRTDTDNDAKLAALSSLSKYKSPRAIEAIKSALADRDHLVRRHAVDLLKQMGAGDFSDRIGVVQTGHDKGFYQRVAARITKKVTATIHTAKGQIRIELFPQDAPTTVDSFITLARRGFFNGVTFHRVVPNFVIQGGDPLGAGDGGPGYQIRCEINTRIYTRGAVGMALSGKDTGGSQFFITHSPQPHLDGGYTVFGRVVSGMEVVDRIERGDVIRRVDIIGSR
jgi:cyclophilin family peptidyl-prolyl cis-trans isomerase/HEAT repeat protein